MRDKTNALHSEQRGSAIFSVVEASFEMGKCVAREQCADLAGDSAFQSFFQNRADEPGHAFGALQRHIADESVGNDYVHLP